jgi:GT2 family glycosyltransferase
VTLPERTVRLILEAPESCPPEAPVQARPQASLLVVTHNNLVFTKLCLESVIANTDVPFYEIVAIDNGSTDDTRAYLDRLARRRPGLVRVAHNRENLGFAAAVNQGVALARGDVLVLLNNDTIVSQGWLRGLVAHLEDPRVGAVGPATNRIGNEAEIETSYQTYGEFEEFARERARQHRGERLEVPALTMFCFALRRETVHRIGLLDERFGLGMLEDDDYSLRLHRAGYALICADDVFVHHFDKASFGHLVPSGQYMALLLANRERFLAKWGFPWQPYRRRRNPTYERLVSCIRDVVRTHVPEGTRILVVSRGDDALLLLERRTALHFPCDSDGTYCGFHPKDGAASIRYLEAARRAGAEYLVIPCTAAWWLTHYHGLESYLRTHSEEVFRQDDVCYIYRLRPAVAEAGRVGSGT